MSLFDVNETSWPLVVLTREGYPTDAQFQEGLQRLRGVCVRGGDWVLVHDARRSDGGSPTRRMALAGLIRENADALRRHCQGMAFVIDSALQRGVITALLWISPLPCPHKMFADFPAARQWALERLAAPRTPG